jgi:hypothetical protein
LPAKSRQGFLFRISQADASEKMTRQQAEYQDTPNGIYSGGMCTLFEPPKACKVVDGEVTKDGSAKPARSRIKLGRTSSVIFKRSRRDNRTSLEKWNFNRGATWQRKQKDPSAESVGGFWLRKFAKSVI